MFSNEWTSFYSYYGIQGHEFLRTFFHMQFQLFFFFYELIEKYFLAPSLFGEFFN